MEHARGSYRAQRDVVMLKDGDGDPKVPPMRPSGDK